MVQNVVRCTIHALHIENGIWQIARTLLRESLGTIPCAAPTIERMFVCCLLAVWRQPSCSKGATKGCVYRPCCVEFAAPV